MEIGSTFTYIKHIPRNYMNDSFTSTIKVIIGSWILHITGIYIGAVMIALIASISRLAYMAEELPRTPCNVVRLFIRLYTMSLGLTLLMVHVGIEYNFSENLTIIYSSMAAFLSEEIYSLIILSKKRIFDKLYKDILK